MPYAQSHYPFENKKEFEDAFPADFIAEGTDQTRGWFYTLLVLSTALFNKPPFKNLIVNGLVLASDGQKMSKRKKNYPDPMLVVNKYGADALRLYLINSPVVKAESLRFKEEGVKDILKDVFLPWYNAYRFLLQNIENYQDTNGVKYLFDEATAYGQSSNVMDKWIISFTQSLLLFVKKEMAAYRLYTVLPRLMKFIDNLTNWYVRTNRKRLKGEGNEPADCLNALHTLFSVLFTMVRVFAPFTPFLTEHMYQNLKKLVDWSDSVSEKERASVHYLMIPQPRTDLINEAIERSVARMQSVIELGRVLRDRKTMPVKYPLPELVVIHKDQTCLDDVASLQDYVLDELNVKKLTLSTDKEQYGVKLRAEPDHKTLGARLKGAFKDVTKEIKALTDKQVTAFIKSGEIDVLGHKLGEEDLRVMYSFDGSNDKYEAHSEADILVLLDCTPDQSMLDEGIAREVVNRVQRLRKKAKLQPSDAVVVRYVVEPATHDLVRIIDQHREYIETSTKNPMVMDKQDGELLVSEDYELKGAKMKLEITKLSSSTRSGSSVSNGPTVAMKDHGKPAVAFVNVVVGSTCGVVLLENPVGANKITTSQQLFDQVALLFGLGKAPATMYLDSSCTKEVGRNLEGVSGKTLFVRPSGSKAVAGACCPFVNLEHNGSKSCLLKENPSGAAITDFAEDAVKLIFGSKVTKVNNQKLSQVTWSKLSGQNVHVQ